MFTLFYFFPFSTLNQNENMAFWLRLKYLIHFRIDRCSKCRWISHLRYYFFVVKAAIHYINLSVTSFLSFWSDSLTIQFWLDFNSTFFLISCLVWIFMISAKFTVCLDLDRALTWDQNSKSRIFILDAILGTLSPQLQHL